MIGNMLGVDSPPKNQPQDNSLSSDFQVASDNQVEASEFQFDQTDIDDDRQNQSYVEEDEENQEEIDFDLLLGDAARTQVDSDEDRDD